MKSTVNYTYSDLFCFINQKTKDYNSVSFFDFFAKKLLLNPKDPVSKRSDKQIKNPVNFDREIVVDS